MNASLKGSHQMAFSGYNIGEGVKKIGDAYLYNATSKETGEKYTLLVLNSKVIDPKSFERIALLLDIFCNVNHPLIENIVEISTMFKDNSNCLAILLKKHGEDSSIKNLYEEIHVKKNSIDPATKLRITYVLASVLKFLHSNKVYLPLLDSRMIGFSDDKVVISAHCLIPNDDKLGNYPWLAPEKSDKLKSEKCDIFSFGSIVYELEYGTYVLNDATDREEYIRRIKKGERPNLREDSINKLIAKCLSQDPQMRPFISEILDDFETGKARFNDTDIEYVKKHMNFDNKNISCSVNFEKNFGDKIKAGDPVFTFLAARLISDENEADSLKLLEKSVAKGFSPASYLMHSIIEQNDTAKAKQLLVDSANDEYIPAVVKLGFILFKSKKYKEAYSLFEKAALADDVIAIRQIATMLLAGTGCERDSKKSEEYLKRGVYFGDANCQFLYASHLIEEGKQDEGLKIFILAGAQGHMRSQQVVASHFTDKKSKNYNPLAGYTILNDMIKQGSTDALYHAGKLLLDGAKGVDKDEKKACEYFEKAGRAGFRKASVEYALCLIDGKGCEKDEAKGVEILENLAQGDIPDAHYNLYLYKHKKDPNVTKTHLLKAAELLHPDACFDIAMTTTDEVEKFKMLEIACNQFHTEAMYEMAMFIGDRHPDKRDILLRQAAEFRHPNSSLIIGKRLLQSSKPDDITNAINMIKDAADAGIPEALFILGKLLLEGKIVDKDTENGKKYIFAASERGFEEASQFIENNYV